MSLLGFLTGQAGRDQAAAEEAQGDALDALYGPDNDPTLLNPDELESTYLGSATDFGESAVGNMPLEGEGRSAQYQALQDLQHLARGFPTDEEVRRYRTEDAQLGAISRGQQGAIGQQLAETRSGGGLGAALQGAQQGAEARADLSASRQAAARARALQAMQELGQLSSEYRREGYDESATRASAIDAFNAANTGYRRDVSQRDTDRRNQRLRQIADARTGRAIRNEEMANQAAARGQQARDTILQAASSSSDRDSERGTGRNNTNTYSGGY